MALRVTGPGGLVTRSLQLLLLGRGPSQGRTPSHRPPRCPGCPEHAGQRAHVPHLPGGWRREGSRHKGTAKPVMDARGGWRDGGARRSPKWPTAQSGTGFPQDRPCGEGAWASAVTPRYPSVPRTEHRKVRRDFLGPDSLQQVG